ncbi:neural cell adhesion molecule 1 [Triplophysa dalaica]|uniref:neural cell adhesion molecule 1 n=1 Tax=Triplophysa dalaica TaxID=1582913 RepID=UPI0024E016FF|nr:neural cell adhesion molecule 1 [Triplophysa dalaica]
MMNLRLLVFSMLLCCCFSAQEENQTLFFGEDFHIAIPEGKVNVSFRPSIGQEREKGLMTSREVIDIRAKLNDGLSHLILENVGESDEGVYIITSGQNTEDVTRITLFVRDCSSEVIVKYGSDFHVVLNDISEPLQVGFRNSTVEATQTSLPGVNLLNDDGTPKENYQDRIIVTLQKFTLQAVTGDDEGSYTFADSNGKVKKKICLNVKSHQIFVTLSDGGTLKINLLLNSSLANLVYTHEAQNTKDVILKRGKLMLPPHLNFEDRLSLEESVCILTEVKASDAGIFTETDLQGFHVSEVYLRIEAYKLPKLYIAIIALVSLLVLLLLVCLVSCLVKIRKRATKARAIEETAKNAGKLEGDAFRQVVKDACTNQNEEAPALSQKEDITEKSQSTEVSIKGLEVSTKEPSLQERNLETSDSGVGFNTSGLPLDSDTDVQTAPIADSEVLSSYAAPDVKTVANQVSEPKTAPSPPKLAPASDLKPAPKSTAPPPPSPEPKPPVSPEPKPAVTPEPKLNLVPIPDTKPTLSPSPEPKQAVTPDLKPEPTKPTADVKPIPSPTPEPPKALTPTPDAKPATTPDAKQAVSPAPEATPAKVSSPAVTPTPDPKAALSPVSEPKATSPAPQSKPPIVEPTTNGTPESKAESPKLDGKDVEAPASAKTPDTGKSSLKTPELISSGGLSPEGKLDMVSPSDIAPTSNADGAATD